MLVIHLDGSYLPSKLQSELADSGVSVEGVTADERRGRVVGVTIIATDSSSEDTIRAVAAAHDPAPPEPTATADPLARLAEIIEAEHGENPITGAQLAEAIAAAQVAP